jgi:DNA-binding transcriptional MerR regulator
MGVENGQIAVESPARAGKCADFASQIVQLMAYTAFSAGFPSQDRALLYLLMATHLSQKRPASAPVTIPDRLYFKIGDVAQICGLETYVLRFWETQFPQLKPNKSGTGQRLYRRREVELVLEIKRLVHGEGYTLAGARQALDAVHRRHDHSGLTVTEAGSGKRPQDTAAVVRNVRAELHEIADLLAAPEPTPLRRRSRLVPVSPSSDSLFPS